MTGTTRFLRALNAAAVGAIVLALLERQAPWSGAYRACIGLSAALLALAILSLFGRGPLATGVAPAITRPRIRAGLAVAPWIGLSVAIAATGSWWILHAWPLRISLMYALALWSIAWGKSDLTGPQVPGSAIRSLVTGFAIVLGILAIDGLAFGLTRFGVLVSAGLGVAASAALSIASFGHPATRQRFAAAGIGMLIGVAGAEAGIRALRLGESALEVDHRDYVRQFHHMPPPGSAFLNSPKVLDEFPPTLVEINEFGIRGPEMPRGAADLLLIGDSFVEARQLPWEATIGPRLAVALRARSSSARVVSHGVRGWSPLLEWNWYLKVGRRLQPRTVMLFFFWNDLWVSGNEAQTFQAVMRPDGRPDHFDVIVEPDWVWYKHVRVLRLVEDVSQRVSLAALRRSLAAGQPRSDLDVGGARELARRMAGDALLAPADVNAILTQPASALSPRLQAVAGSEFWPGMRPVSLWTDTQRKAAEETERELQLFAEDVSRDGGRLVVVYVPNAYQISASECAVARLLVGLDGDGVLPADSGIQAWLRGVADRHGFALLDPSDAMREYHRSQPAAAPLYLRADCHWSAGGHDFMANYLADWYIRAQGGGR